MTSANENVTPDAGTKEEEVLAPATPGAEALPLPDDEVDKPSEG
ncbi:hypothetical protein [Mycolicibacterium litorale]|nr:hypothetical protein [Mycolicibacterium litorale]